LLAPFANKGSSTYILDFSRAYKSDKSEESIFDPMLVKPKGFLSTIFNSQNEFTSLKRLLALPTWGQKCLFSE